MIRSGAPARAAAARVDVLPFVAVLATLAPGKAQTRWGSAQRAPGTEWDFYASHQHVAELAAKGTRTAERAMGFLRSEGWLVQTRRGGWRGANNALTASHYRLAASSEPATHGGLGDAANPPPVAGSGPLIGKSEPATDPPANPPPMADQGSTYSREKYFRGNSMHASLSTRGARDDDDAMRGASR